MTLSYPAGFDDDPQPQTQQPIPPWDGRCDRCQSRANGVTRTVDIDSFTCPRCDAAKALNVHWWYVAAIYRRAGVMTVELRDGSVHEVTG